MNASEAEMKLAEEMLQDAELMLKENRLRSLVNRAYYGMFHATRAILLYLGTDCTSHAGAINKFGECVIKKGLAKEELAKSLHLGYRLREKSDYQPVSKINKEEAKALYNEAKGFVREIEKILRQLKGGENTK
jgi:uncharacterized protein (UPF0332 family)